MKGDGQGKAEATAEGQWKARRRRRTTAEGSRRGGGGRRRLAAVGGGDGGPKTEAMAATRGRASVGIEAELAEEELTRLDDSYVDLYGRKTGAPQRFARRFHAARE